MIFNSNHILIGLCLTASFNCSASKLNIEANDSKHIEAEFYQGGYTQETIDEHPAELVKDKITKILKLKTTKIVHSKDSTSPTVLMIEVNSPNFYFNKDNDKSLISFEAKTKISCRTNKDRKAIIAKNHFITSAIPARHNTKSANINDAKLIWNNSATALSNAIINNKSVLNYLKKCGFTIQPQTQEVDLQRLAKMTEGK